jgi:hypothetical protein
MTGLRAQQFAAALAVVEELAGIDGHDFPRAEAASRTGNHALELDGFGHDSIFVYLSDPKLGCAKEQARCDGMIGCRAKDMQ